LIEANTLTTTLYAATQIYLLTYLCETSDTVLHTHRHTGHSVEKGKEDHTPYEHWWCAHLPFYGREPVGG